MHSIDGAVGEPFERDVSAWYKRARKYFNNELRSSVCVIEGAVADVLPLKIRTGDRNSVVVLCHHKLHAGIMR